MTTSRHVSVLSDILGLLTRNYANKRRFLKDVLTKANTLIGSDAGFVGLVQSDGQRDVVTVWDRYQQLVGAQHGRWDEDVHDLQIGGADLPKKDRSMTGYVAFTRKPRRSGNVRRETFYRESRRETRSQLTVPIVLGTQTLGVINLESREANFYTAEHETILALVARLIAPTLDGMIARQGLGHGVGDLLQSVGRELESLPPGLPIGAHTFDALARTLAKALSSRTCRIWLIQRPHPLRLLLRGAFGATPRYRFRRELLAHPAGASLRRTVSVKSDTQRTRRPSLAIVPILSGGHAIGFVELSARARRRDNPDSAYTTADLHALQIVGGQIAVTVEANALQAARREQDLKQARQLSVFSQVFGELDLQKTFEAAVDGIRRLMGARSCSIFLWDDALETFVLRATRGIDQKWVGKANYKPAEGLTGWIGQHGRPLNLRNRTKAELARIHPDLRWGKKYTDPKHADEQAPLLGVPIFLSGRSAGVIWMSDRPSRGPFTEFDQQMLTAVASHLASAIVYGQRTDGRQLVLRTVGQLIQSLEARVNAFKGGGSLTAPRASSIITSALDEVRQQLKADTVTLYPFLPKLQLFRTPPFSAGLIKHPKLMEHAIHSHDAPWQVMKKSPRFWKSVATHRAISGRRPAQSDQPERQRFAVREAVASAAAVRLDIEGEPVGVLFVNYGSPQSFLTPQRELIKTLAGHLALAVALASLYRQMRALTSLEERDFLGQDLHDGALAAVDVAVDFADHARHALGQGDREAAAQHLTVAMGAANHASSELRDLISMFKKSLIDELGLVGALRQLNELWRLEGLQVSLKTRDVPVPPRFARHLFRIIQCAVHNARSGGARQVTVTIEPTAKSIFLSIADNGTGFVVEEADKPFHFGVRGMRRRALRLGGTAEIASTLGVGTVVNVTVPLDGGVYDKES